jgi:hypothetical protein
MGTVDKNEILSERKPLNDPKKLQISILCAELSREWDHFSPYDFVRLSVEHGKSLDRILFVLQRLRRNRGEINSPWRYADELFKKELTNG